MLLIPCPWCGPRPEIEFRYGAQADVSYPSDPATCTDREWVEFVYLRDNPEGWFTERWVHTHGCRRWCTVVRHTVTNRIAASYPPGARPSNPPPRREAS